MINFSQSLSTAIRYVVDIHTQELGDELDGVEEVVGDHLEGDSYKEWRSLIDQYGFEAVTKAVKQRFL